MHLGFSCRKPYNFAIWAWRRRAACFRVSYDDRKGSTLTTVTKRSGGYSSAPAENGHGPAEAGQFKIILTSLEDSKAEEIISIDIRGKSALADFMVIASGRSPRHVAAIAEHLLRQLKAVCSDPVRVEGLSGADWVLIDAGDVIIHLFRPEVRLFYNLEKMWSEP